MGLVQSAYAITRTLITFTVSVVLGVLYTILSPLRKPHNEALALKAERLNEEVVQKMKCGAVSKYITVPTTNVRLHVVEAGDPNGKFIVLLHGFPDAWHAWSEVIPTLVKAGYHVVAPDMRGYNLSEKPLGVSNYKINTLVSDVAGLWEYYKVEQGYLVAHDWGGVVAWIFAGEYPELLHKLIMINSPHTLAYRRELKRGLRQRLAAWYILFFQIPYLAASRFTFFAEHMVVAMFGSVRRHYRKVSDKQIELYASGWVQPNAFPSMVNYYKALLRDMIRNVRRKTFVSTPTLIIWGVDDTHITIENAECSEWVPDSKIHYVENCSHWVMQEAPEEVAQQIIEFTK